MKFVYTKYLEDYEIGIKLMRMILKLGVYDDISLFSYYLTTTLHQIHNPPHNLKFVL